MNRGRSITRVPRKRSRYVSRSRSRTPMRPMRSPVYTTEGQFQRVGSSYGLTRIKRTWDVGVLSLPANAATAVGVATFQLGFLPNFAEITNLYAQYRVDRIIMTFMPVGTSAVLYTSVDYNDQTQLTLPQILERDNCHVTPPGQTFTLSYKPRIAVDIENGVGVNPNSGFLVSANTSVNHLGVKYAISRSSNATSGAAEVMYRSVAKVYLSVRNAK